MNGRWVIVRDGGGFHAELRSSNGKVVMFTPNHNTRRAARRGITICYEHVLDYEPEVEHPATPAEVERCPECRHVPHGSLGFCPNMASDNDCSCTYTPPAEPDAGDVGDERLGTMERHTLAACWNDADGKHAEPRWDEVLHIVERIVTDRVRAAAVAGEKRGREQALRDAADELRGPSFSGGIQWGRTDYLGWLNDLADKEARA